MQRTITSSKYISIYAAIISLAFSIYSYTLSINILPYYQFGDQEHYRNFYNEIYKFDLISGYDYLSKTLSTREPMYLVIAYYLSPYIDKDVLMSILNAILGFSLSYIIIKNGASIYVLPFLSINYYLMVLFFAAERLKIAILFYLLSFVVWRRLKASLIVMSILSHIQVALLVYLQYANEIISIFRGISSENKTRNILYLFLLILVVFTTLYYLKDHIYSKVGSYIVKGEPYTLGMLKAAIFMILTVYYASGDKLSPVIQHLPIIVMLYFLKTDRFVIFSYIIFMYYALKVNRGINLGVIIVSIYFLVKGNDFIERIIEYGTGY